MNLKTLLHLMNNLKLNWKTAACTKVNGGVIVGMEWVIRNGLMALGMKVFGRIIKHMLKASFNTCMEICTKES